MTSLRAKWLVTGGAAIFAVVAFFSGFDRITAHQPNDERLIPAPFRVDADRVAASLYLLGREPELAQAAASRAILADPLDARGPAFLGAAAYRAGRTELAERAMKTATQLSPREPLSRAALAAHAIERGEVEEAALHFDALLRAQPAARELDVLFSMMESSEDGRAELARRLAGETLWSEAYLRAEGQRQEVLRDRARFLTIRSEQIGLECSRVEPLVRALADRNLRADAQALQAANCTDPESNQLLIDPSFERLGQDALFGWRRHRSGDVQISAVGTEDRRVEMSNRTSVTRLVLSQPVALKAGEYRAFGSVAGANSDTLLASLDCGTPTRPGQGGGALARGQLLRAPDCDNQVFGIWLRPGAGAVSLDNMRLEAVGQPD
ncbi:tetratricopeptide repeat protein [Qipengyuania seohaensis]|uniref:tetratricopeptide repeat protein n=1 Tax=Qipengyuania seohaensis TaxID=266951 RepID=UPI000C220E45|nr:hypothetical protein [Qipengyuania seohaensis]